MKLHVPGAAAAHTRQDPTMTCEDTAVRLTWEIQAYDPHARAWLCRAYGRATTTAPPDDIARAALIGYLAICPPRDGERVRARSWPDDGQPVTVIPDELPTDGWTIGADVHQALPRYLRDALAVAG